MNTTRLQGSPTLENSSQLNKRTIDTQLQSLFTAILNQSDLQGFESLENDWQTESYRQLLTSNLNDSIPDEDIATEISDLWNQWVQTKGSTRYQELSNPHQHIARFNNILVQAQMDDAYLAPTAFLKRLPSEDLQSIQRIHGLAEPIELAELSFEGAVNLLLPPSAQIDFDENGLTESGSGQSLRFPDSQTPTEVVNAWDIATASLSEGEKMIRVLQMKIDVVLSNIHQDSLTGRVTVIEPGQPGFTNPYADPNFSYQHDVEKRLASIEFFKDQTPAEQYERDVHFWTDLQAALLLSGAN